MAGHPNLLEQRADYQPRFVSTKMDPSLKIDEGYSEDARSQDDPDSPMRLDAMSDGVLSQSWSVAAGIPAQIMALSEAERSGTITRCPHEIHEVSTDKFVGRLCL